MIRLPDSLARTFSDALGTLLQSPSGPQFDFEKPPGEHALFLPSSVSWRVFKNPVALFIGGMAAVILELAEPAVRSGVWQHSAFRTDPMSRLRRTGLSAMVTIYGAKSIAEPMIGGIVRRHARINGFTPAGSPYSASDVGLLNWVHATASFGFAAAYDRYVSLLRSQEFDALYREAVPVARLYGAKNAPASTTDMTALFGSLQTRLEPSQIIFDYLHIMRTAPALPARLRWLQRLMVRAAVDLIPGWIRERLGLTNFYGLGPHEKRLVDWAAGVADRICLARSPACRACRRLGLPSTYLYV